MTEEEIRAHQEQLNSERRTCAQCGYVIDNPVAERCPRCNSPVERKVKSCGGCSFKGGCDFAQQLDDRKK
ncbi:MAG: hypothetical protein C0600_13735 [Ignavibacteria bacterium]|mgnify:CR=1 FL=1|nr:MAG: hypothetical protein C0600_13735 [Ignavibacteria bacterium]